VDRVLSKEAETYGLASISLRYGNAAVAVGRRASATSRRAISFPWRSRSRLGGVVNS